MKVKVIATNMEDITVEVDGTTFHLDMSGCWRCGTKDCIGGCRGILQVGQEFECVKMCDYGFVTQEQ